MEYNHNKNIDLSWGRGRRTRGRTRRPGVRAGGCGGRENNEKYAREARLARPGIGYKGGREKRFIDVDFE
jgi:hypothetical protein